MDIEAKILTVMDGQPKEIEMFGEIYNVSKKEQVKSVQTTLDDFGQEDAIVKIKTYKIKYRKPKDGFDRSKKYDVWITEKDMNRVKRAINLWKLNYKPTFRNMLKQPVCGLSENRLRGTLDIMLKHQMIEIKKEGQHKVYRMK